MAARSVVRGSVSIPHASRHGIPAAQPHSGLMFWPPGSSCPRVREATGNSANLLRCGCLVMAVGEDSHPRQIGVFFWGTVGASVGAPKARGGSRMVGNDLVENLDG